MKYDLHKGKEMLRDSEMEIDKAMNVEKEGVLGHIASKDKE